MTSIRKISDRKVDVAYFKVMSQHLAWEEEKHENLSMDSESLDQDPNLSSSKYEAVLPLHCNIWYPLSLTTRAWKIYIKIQIMRKKISLIL
jgi:hypothetical protein